MPAGRGSQAGPGTGEAVLLRNLVAVCSHLSTLAAQTAELSPILEILAEEIECAVTVVNTAFEVLGFAPGAGSRVTAAQLRSDATQSTLRRY